MELWDYSLDSSLFARVGSRAFRQCEARDYRQTIYPRLGTVAERCGGTAMRGMTWEGRTEGQHSALLCDRHTLAYLGPMVVQVREE